jgi:transcriptional regulator with XRE-family HTH domain
MIGQTQAEVPAMSFARLLRQLRAEARLTQEELAWKSGRSPRSISDLERGISRTTRKDTAILLADALAIEGSVRTAFVAAARGRAPATDVLTARAAAIVSTPEGPMPGRAGSDKSLRLDEIRLTGKLIDVMTPLAGSDGNPIAVIVLIGLTALEGIRADQLSLLPSI